MSFVENILIVFFKFIDGKSKIDEKDILFLLFMNKIWIIKLLLVVLKINKFVVRLLSR